LVIVDSWLEAIPDLWLQLATVGVWLGIIVLLAESLQRSKKTDAEVIRKIVHIGVGNVILLAWWFHIPSWIGIGASILASAIALLSYRVPILASVNGVGRKSLGTFFYAISFGILITCFWETHPYYTVLGILTMTWGDGLAALVGQRWGRHPYRLWEMQKSWEGSLAMFVASFVVSSSILLGIQGSSWQTWVAALAIALVATGLEAFSKFGIDNFTVPIGSALIGYWLNQVWTAPLQEAIAKMVSNL
jgi:phytol kinase